MKRSISLLTLLLLIYAPFAYSQKSKPSTKAASPVPEKSEKPEEINWIGFEDAVRLNEKEPRKILIDVYTHWCGWCKRMDATTFKDPAVVEYVRKNYYAVKLDAETKDTITFRNNKTNDSLQSQEKKFVFRPEFKANELAVSLLGGKMGYPTTVLMDENYSLMSPPIPGFQDAKSMELILKYYGKEAYKTMNFEDFRKSFPSEAK
jgi:thioredoxin-related protein